MKPYRVLDKYFEVYGQTDKITPEAGKKGSFITNQNIINYSRHSRDFRFDIPKKL